MSTAPAKVFVRDATGLVRQFSWFDALMISMAAIGPGIFGFSSQIAFVASADPNADILATCYLGLALSLPIAIVYWMMSLAMPRSGGDYVWVSRVLNPVIGFMVGWGFWIVILSFVGSEAYLFSSTVLPIFLASFGYGWNNPSLVSMASAVTTTGPVLVIGILLLILTTSIAGFGAGIFKRSMAFFFVLSVIATIASIAVLGSTTHADFINAFNGFAGQTYNSIISQAQAAGWTFSPITLGGTLLGAPLAVVLFLGWNGASAAAGEVRAVNRSMLYALIGSLIVAFIIDGLGIMFSMNTFGYDFIQAVTVKWSLAPPPWPIFLMTPLLTNPVLLCLIQLGWLEVLPWSMAGWTLVATRYVFAFSFDRVFPVKLADINDRFHFPVKAAIANFVGACVFFALAAFTPFLGLWLNSIAIASLVWLVASVAAIVLPFKMKGIADLLPGKSWKVPLVSIVGFISMVCMLANFYWDATTPAIGPSTFQADLILLGIMIAGILVFTISYFTRKSQGIDLRLVYAQLPPE